MNILKKISLVALFSVSTVSFAATVQKIDKKGKITIDASKGDGIKKGDRYCFYNTKNKRVACGRVTKVTKKDATVAVAKKNIKSIKKGYEARPRDEKMATSNVADFKVRDNPKETGGSNIKLFYSMSLLPQGGYDVPKYSPETFSNDLVWDKPDEDKRQIPMSFAGGGGEFEYALSSSMSLAAGGRFKMFNPQTLTANRSNSSAEKSQYVETVADATSFGGWVDYYFLNLKMGSGIGLKLGGGLDFEMTTVTASSTHKDDNDTAKNDPVTQGEASAMIMSIRFPIDFYWYFGHFGVGARAVLMYAAVGFGDSFSGTYDDAATPSDVADVDPNAILGQYQEAIGLTANGLAVEILPISLIYVF